MIIKWIKFVSIIAILALVPAILISTFLTWGFSTSWGKSKRAVVAVTNSGTQVASINQTIQYEWYWKLDNGETFPNGRNEAAPGERTMELVSDGNSDHLCFNLHYYEYGKPEIMRVRLAKTGEKTWGGTWEQENPKEGGKMTVNEISPGVYAGTMTDQGKVARCYLKKK